MHASSLRYADWVYPRAPVAVFVWWLACSACSSQLEEPAPEPPLEHCAANEVALSDGSCLFAGMAPEDCAVGFVHDGALGCEPVLPAEACPFGQLAAVGETTCREVAPCGDGTWGDIPVEASTQHVDGGYPGSNSDGSSTRPWTTIGAAFAAAEPNAIIAVAEGSYGEDVSIEGKAVRLWGRCPSLVEVVGTGQQPAAILITTAAPGTEVRNLAITGAGAGVAQTDSVDVVLEALWIHDLGFRGVVVQETQAPTRVRLAGSLVERNKEMGVYLAGGQITIESCVVRDTATYPPDVTGHGYGYGIGIHDHPITGVRAEGLIRSCVVEWNHDQGVLVAGSDVTIEASVIRDTQPDDYGGFGQGASIIDGRFAAQRANVTLRGCMVERNRKGGVLIGGSDVVIEATTVRHSLPNAQGAYGGGVAVQDDPATGHRGMLTLVRSVVQHNHRTGLFVGGSDAVVERSVVRDTLPTPAGFFGDGVTVVNRGETGSEGNLLMRDSRIEHNLRAGLAVFGATAALAGSVVSCNAFELTTDVIFDKPATLKDDGGNFCGCPQVSDSCHAVSPGLEPPEPL